MSTDSLLVEKDRDLFAVQCHVWQLKAFFEAQIRLLPETCDAGNDVLTARMLAAAGRDLADNIGNYMQGNVEHVPGIDIMAEGTSHE